MPRTTFLDGLLRLPLLQLLLVLRARHVHFSELALLSVNADRAPDEKMY